MEAVWLRRPQSPSMCACNFSLAPAIRAARRARRCIGCCLSRPHEGGASYFVFQPEGQAAVLITGCTGGIGQATARTFARSGCSVAVHYQAASSHAKADTLISDLKAIASSDARFAIFQTDLSNYDEVRRLHAEVVQQIGHPDILFANHGIAGHKIGPLLGNINDVPMEVFEEMWWTNTGTSYMFAQLCVLHMEAQKYEHVIFTSSIAAGNSGVIEPHYTSFKAALHGLVHWLSLWYAKDGIKSSAIAPALIEDTATMANLMPEMRSKTPIGQLGKPDKMACGGLAAVTLFPTRTRADAHAHEEQQSEAGAGLVWRVTQTYQHAVPGVHEPAGKPAAGAGAREGAGTRGRMRCGA
ncbi:3-oxoacyl-reductase [Sparassis crispa]|uniref:3-oxoacyl-reductase n=1 Tax=Sparassis crispa TaxID=139825 RepID=A0A401H3F2_9APHY|nr:3-oxoacyl-reductase [Sparassis crispa]GBE88957.1 3-oxoacyl-reductase [Sparassis crispa]